MHTEGRAIKGEGKPADGDWTPRRGAKLPMRKTHGSSSSLALLALLASCATQAPPPTPAAPLVAPSPPAGSQRLPGSLTCESEVSCSACADDHDRELVRLAFLIHAAEVRACYDRVAATHPGTEGRVIVRVGVDPQGAVRTSCIVRTSLNDAAIDHCLTDLVLTWKVPAPASGGWALVDHPFVFAKSGAP
jgi:TonB family protein